MREATFNVSALSINKNPFDLGMQSSGETERVAIIKSPSGNRCRLRRLRLLRMEFKRSQRFVAIESIFIAVLSITVTGLYKANAPSTD